MKRNRRVYTEPNGPIKFQIPLDMSGGVFKGDNDSYTLFKEAVQNLRNHSDIKISSIPKGSQIEKWLSIVQSATSVLYNRPELYNKLIKIINEEWAGFPEEQIHHDTIAAQIVGCLFSKDSCDPKCAGKAVQKPINEQSVCDVTLTVAQMKDDGVVDFQTLNYVKDASDGKTIINYIGTFEGLTRSEKDILRRIGFKSAKIRDTNGELTSDFVPIDQIQTRVPKPIETSKGPDDTSDNKWVWILIGILIVLLLVFLISRSRRS